MGFALGRYGTYVNMYCVQAFIDSIGLSNLRNKHIDGQSPPPTLLPPQKRFPECIVVSTVRDISISSPISISISISILFLFTLRFEHVARAVLPHQTSYTNRNRASSMTQYMSRLSASELMSTLIGEVQGKREGSLVVKVRPTFRA